MTMTISGTSGLTFPDTTTMTTGQQACKAWVRFQGGNTNTAGVISAAYNVSSVTRNSAGDYTISFTNALSDANYAITGSAVHTGATSALAIWGGSTYSQTTSAVRLVTGTGAIIDVNFASIAVFR